MRRFRHLYPDLNKLQQVLAQPETAYARLFPKGKISEAAIDNRRKLKRLHKIESTRASIEKMQRSTDDLEMEFTSLEIGSIEDLILLARPAMIFENGIYQPAPSPMLSDGIDWNGLLEPYRQNIEENAKSVGRIEFKQAHEDLFWGTGFLVADNVIMTNRHVAELFCEKDTPTSEWKFKPECTCKRIDYCEEYKTDPSREFRITNILKIYENPDPDIALLKVAKTSHDRDLPPPLVLADSLPDPVEDVNAQPQEKRKVYALGYPFRDITREFSSDLDAVFQGIYEVKRLQPGLFNDVNANDYVLYHDCSTIAGNSGSCIIDVKLNQVLGIHFSGVLSAEYNEAVAFPLLSNSMKNDFKQFGVEFA
jgi:hypothetical protein